MTTLREKVTLATLAAATAVGASLLASPDAEATPLSYLQALNVAGLVVDDTAAALRTGYAVCAALNSATGDVVAANLYLSTDVETPYMAGVIVVTAVEQLCPWHDHRGMSV
ncbi:DUF732 domain-containing protein [Mycolicibacterium gilvum]|uniref:DUF732 domain-containing protein n=1 Tax=Mycolicibacterium gilvum TaxID=1804 RepID=UPI004046609E